MEGMEGSTNVIARSLCECGNGGGRIKYTPMKLNPTSAGCPPLL